MLTTFTIPTQGKRLYEFTDEAARWIAGGEIGTGLLTLFCRHTSASLLINENAAPAVQRDLLAWLERAAPEGSHYEHDAEGPDDMPAHIRTMLTGTSLVVPVEQGRMLLGTWQGLYLAEHRAAPHRREVVAHVLGE
jgi:secondary thiamine-phosphate synthase enzyme